MTWGYHTGYGVSESYSMSRRFTGPIKEATIEVPSDVIKADAVGLLRIMVTKSL